MNPADNPKTAVTGPESDRPVSPPGEELFSTAQATDGWTPEDRPPSAAENNFMSFALFGFLILFGVGCFILF